MADSKTNNIFSKIGAFYDRVTEGDSAVYREISLAIRPYLAPEKNVLNLACGTGLIARAMAPYVQFVEAADRSPRLIESARRRDCPASLHYAVQDESALPYEAQSFDLVVMVNALQKNSSPEKVLSEIRRVLRDDGTLIAPVLVNDETKGVPRRVLLSSFITLGTSSPWTANTYFEFLLSNGFMVTEQHIITNGVQLPVCFATAVKTVK